MTDASHNNQAARIMEFLRKWIRRANSGLFCLAGICLMLMMALACSNMVMRFFGHPIKGTFELMGFLGAMAAALALAGTQAGGGHIVITLFQRHFPRKMRRMLDILTSCINLFFFGLMAWQTFELALGIREFEELSETLQIVYYPFILVVCLGVGALVVQIVLETMMLAGGRGDES